MPHAPKDLSGYLDHGFDTLIDVRSPSEFAEDHIPGALNMPVLNDAERAKVGTIYKQVSAFDARKVGGALVARNTARHVEERLADKDGGWRPLVHCWRGGMRSGAFATVLRSIGWRTQTLEGGYKAYRAAVVDALYEEDFRTPVVLLAGNTGTAKTAILQRLGAYGLQTLDLEGLANHRGSLFGAVGRQPSQKMFESRLAEAVTALDPKRPVVIEAESSKVGERSIPVSIWQAMKAAKSVRVTAPLEERAAFTVRTYAEIAEDTRRLSELIDKLRPYHPKARVEAWQTLAATGDYTALSAGLMEHHYDPRYEKQRSRDGEVAGTVSLESLREQDLDAAAARVAEAILTVEG